MRQRRKLNPNPNEDLIAKKDLFLSAASDFALKNDDDLLTMWEKAREEIKKFYAEEYVPALIKNGELLTQINKLSIALFQRKVFDEKQLAQTAQLLQKSLEEILQRYEK